MLETIQNLWHVIQDPANRDTLTWLGTGIAGVAAAIWAVVKYFAERMDLAQKFAAENADLVRRLREQAPAGPQAPGSQQAVAEAVGATAAGAAAGNPRAKQALKLLNAGSIADAVPLFQAEAAEKEAASRASAEEAAAAYRNLGAIAGLADPKRALDAYEKAV